jgi:plastocyanin
MTRRMMRFMLAGSVFALAGGLMFEAPPASATSHAITVAHYAFGPATLTVRAGDTVVWTNTDQAPHDVTTTQAPVALKSPTLTTGERWSYTFTTAGTYSYICSIHPDMHGTVIVTAPASTTTANKAARAVPSHADHATPPVAAATTRTATAHQPTIAHSSAPATLPTAAAQQPATSSVATAGTTTSTTLNPLLLLAGLVGGAATLCLLLLAAQAESADEPGKDAGKPPPT